MPRLAGLLFHSGAIFGLLTLIAPPVLGDPSPAPSSWHAFLSDGDTRKIVPDATKLNNGELARLEYSDYQGTRARLAVAPVQSALPGSPNVNLDASLPYWWWYGWAGAADVISYEGGQLPVGDISSIVTAALQNTHRFRVLERSQIEQILAEQDLGAGGRISAATAPKVGDMVGAQYLILTSVNLWNPSASSKGLGLGGITGGALGVGNINSKKAKVEMTFRVVDAATGEVVSVVRSKGESGGFKLGVGALGWTGALIGGMGHLGKDPDATAAVVACVTRAIHQIATNLDAKPWTSSIAKVTPEKVFVRGGEDVGLTPGLELVAFSKGEAITDENGATIGWDMSECGRLRIVSVQEKIAVATIESGCTDLKTGDLVKEVKGP